MSSYDSGPLFKKLRAIHHGIKAYQTAEDLEQERREVLAYEWDDKPISEPERERIEVQDYRSCLLQAIPLDDSQCFWYERPILQELYQAGQKQKSPSPWWLISPLRSFVLWRLFKRGLADRQTINVLYGEVTSYCLTSKGVRLARSLAQ